MENKNLSRSYLETLSTADLIALADDFDIDIPDNLNRCFIIGELLEVSEEVNQKKIEEDINTEDGEVPVNSVDDKLPDTYNETVICAILRNPAWVYVYWDIKNSDLIRLNIGNGFLSLVLRVSFFDDIISNSPIETFDVQIGVSDRQQYVLLPPGKKFMRIDLVAKFSGKEDENLAVSRKIELPEGPSILNNALPGRDVEITPILKLSGMKNILKSHYEHHRQSFS